MVQAAVSLLSGVGSEAVDVGAELSGAGLSACRMSQGISSTAAAITAAAATVKPMIRHTRFARLRRLCRPCRGEREKEEPDIEKPYPFYKAKADADGHSAVHPAPQRQLYAVHIDKTIGETFRFRNRCTPIALSTIKVYHKTGKKQHRRRLPPIFAPLLCNLSSIPGKIWAKILSIPKNSGGKCRRFMVKWR